MKKFFVLILVLCIAIGCFVACDEGRESSADKKTTLTPIATAVDSETEDALLNDDNFINKGEISGDSYDASEIEPQVTFTQGVSPSGEIDAGLETPATTKVPHGSTVTPAPTSTPSYTFSQNIVDTPDIWSSPNVTSTPTSTAWPTTTNSPVSTSTRYPGYQTTPTAVITPIPTTTCSPVVKPDNSDKDCIAIDFRGGSDACYDYNDGYFSLMTTMDTSIDCYLEPIDSRNGDYGYLNVEIEGSDPFFYMYNLGGRECYPQIMNFDIQEYPIIKIVMKNGTASSSFEFFLFKQNYNCSDSERFTVSGISKNDTDFKTYYIDLRISGASNSLSVSTFPTLVLQKCDFRPPNPSRRLLLRWLRFP